ncbi:alpha/beta hydrolase [Psychrobacter urativorans]|uniref:alpha/beta hydrolase n=1 Tax=Psychrobacter urativorans TaxID=45610 RepID=UPI001919B988|nr:alpha/beta hydrolase [Psychrobacter urativorans]
MKNTKKDCHLTDKPANGTTVTNSQTAKLQAQELQGNKPQTPKPRGLKLAGAGVTAVIAIGGIALAAQQAQALSALSLVNTFTSSGGVGVTKNILYGDAPLQDLDMYYPKPLAQAMQTQAQESISESYPMVVFVHGGSWESGSKEDYAFVGQSLAQAGYITAVINYRKAPEHVYPDYVEDTAKAIAWSHDNAANFHADPQRLAVVGHSAGAFNMMAAVSNSDFLAPYGISPKDISAVIGIAGPYSYDFRKYGSSSAFANDVTPDEVMPDRHIKGTQPPYLLLTAENDKTVYDQNTINMTKALRKYGATVENGVIKGASHATSIGAMAPPLRWLNDVRAQVLRYLDKELN